MEKSSFTHLAAPSTWQCFGPCFALKSARANDLDLEVTSSVAHAQLDVAQSGGGQHLSADQLSGAQTLDEFR